MNPIKLARTLDGVRAVEVARKTKIDRTIISLFENGWREPTAAQLERIRKVLPSFDRAVAILEGKKG